MKIEQRKLEKKVSAREEVKKLAQEEIDRQLELIEIIKSSQVRESIKKKAFKDIMKFITTEQFIVISSRFLKESYSLFDYLIQLKEARAIDEIMKYRSKMLLKLPKEKQFDLKHEEILEKLIEIDAEYDMDFVVKRHIKSALSGEYGHIKSTFKEEDYKSMFEDFKAKKFDAQV